MVDGAPCLLGRKRTSVVHTNNCCFGGGFRCKPSVELIDGRARQAFHGAGLAVRTDSATFFKDCVSGRHSKHLQQQQQQQQQR